MPLADVPHKFVEVAGGRIELDPAGIEFRGVQHAVDETRQAARGAADLLNPHHEFVVARILSAPKDPLGAGIEDGQRCAELVGHHRDEAAIGAGRLALPVEGRLQRPGRMLVGRDVDQPHEDDAALGAVTERRAQTSRLINRSSSISSVGTSSETSRPSAPSQIAKQRRKAEQVHVLRAPDRDRFGGADPLVGEEQVPLRIEGRKAVGRGLDGGDQALLRLLQRRGALLDLDLEIDGLTFGLLARLPLLGHIAHEGDAELPLGESQRKAAHLEAFLVAVDRHSPRIRGSSLRLRRPAERRHHALVGEERVERLEALAHGVVRPHPEETLHARVPQQAMQPLVENDDALVADIVDDEVGKFLLLPEQPLRLVGLLHPLEEPQQQKRCRDDDPEDERQALDHRAQIRRAGLRAMFARQQQHLVGDIAQFVGEIPGLGSQLQSALAVERLFQQRLAPGVI